MRFLPLRKQRRAIPLVLLTFVLFILIFFALRLSFIAQTAHAVRASLYEIGSWSGGLITDIFSTRAALKKENERLISEVTRLALDQAELDRLRQEDKDLKALLRYKDRSDYHLTTAHVLSRSPERSGQRFLVDRGSLDDVTLGQAVVASDGILIGRVLEVSLNTSLVQLITDHASKFGVRLLNQTAGTIGIAEGSDGEIIHIAYIPQDISVDVDSVVVSSGLDNGIPAGLVIGVVTSVLTNEHDPFQSATVEPPIDLRTLRFVSILTFAP